MSTSAHIGTDVGTWNTVNIGMSSEPGLCNLASHLTLKNKHDKGSRKIWYKDKTRRFWIQKEHVKTQRDN
ncbi:hypothetical protein KC19_1G085500 [Ceratodon purpureus]|uniref:Uncharacterized protein n=1 Tax=Ceratodon purpureus TaxID=3225 RepID=A0A8T0J4V3_CERPU|nr:hypothetical protein KC19_1G085500 [Ceratodon purpureus]